MTWFSFICFASSFLVLGGCEWRNGESGCVRVSVAGSSVPDWEGVGPGSGDQVRVVWGRQWAVAGAGGARGFDFFRVTVRRRGWSVEFELYECTKSDMWLIGVWWCVLQLQTGLAGSLERTEYGALIQSERHSQVRLLPPFGLHRGQWNAGRCSPNGACHAARSTLQCGRVHRHSNSHVYGAGGSSFCLWLVDVIQAGVSLPPSQGVFTPTTQSLFFRWLSLSGSND